MPLHSDTFSLRAVHRLGSKDSFDTTAWFDVKFYPYTSPGASPIFALAGGNNALICRCVLREQSSIEILRSFQDEEEGVCYNSLEWSRDENGDPIICLTGETPKINVLNVKTGQLVTTLAGHGDAINDIAVSPVDPTCLASASNDNSVRIWTLDLAHKQQPTAAIAFGAGHDQQVLALGWHRKGQYLLTGGMDTRVNLWMIPYNVSDHLGTDRPASLHYPHFSSTEVHTDYIDCVRFYNDIILSRAANENKILLWRIEGFNSDNPPPSSAPIPPTQSVRSDNPVYIPRSQVSGTRSAWGGRFQRLLQFDQPDATNFYIRFGLFHEAGRHPILAAGNFLGKLSFWDLENLEEAGVGNDEATKTKTKDPALKADVFCRIRESSEVSNVSSTAQSTSSTLSTGTGTNSSPRKGVAVPISKKKQSVKPAKTTDDRVTTGIGNPFQSIAAHRTHIISKSPFTVRQVSFNRGGDWCIACGDNGMVAIFSRWGDGFPETHDT